MTSGDAPFAIQAWKGSSVVPSSVLCRAQESLHRRRAADTTLENVRLVATSAAVAWAKEAVAAESREARHSRIRTLAHADSGVEPGIAARDLLPGEGAMPINA